MTDRSPAFSIDLNLLNRFELELVPTELSKSSIPAKILGYGEISSIFQIGDDREIVYKRLPLFQTITSAGAYKNLYHEYCSVLRTAGLSLPDDDAVVIAAPGRPVSVYFIQRRYDSKDFCHQLLNQLDKSGIQLMVERILESLEAVWNFNNQHHPELETAIDAQLSNWVRVNEAGKTSLHLVDTSTPFLRKQGKEQLDLDLLLLSVPWFIRWAIRRLNLDDVIGRYYDKRKVLTDLVANLYKEQRPDLIPLFLELINAAFSQKLGFLTTKEIDKYYQEDKMIWTLFSVLRRADRFITTRLLRKRYEFILPGKVKR